MCKELLQIIPLGSYFDLAELEGKDSGWKPDCELCPAECVGVIS